MASPNVTPLEDSAESDEDPLTKKMGMDDEEGDADDESQTKSASFHVLVKNLIQAHHSTLNQVDLQPLTKRVLYPSGAGDRILRVPLTDGEALSEEALIDLRNFAFGLPEIASFTCGDWLETSFQFDTPGNAHASWSMKVNNNSTKGLIILMRPDRKTQEDCLAFAISDILWKCGEKQKAVLCLKHDTDRLENTENFRGDGLTEKVHVLNFKKQDDLTFNIKKYLFQFINEEKDDGGGTCLLLYSLIMTKGIDKIKSEMEEPNATAVCTNGTLHRSIATMIITGRATPYLHNGVIYEGSEATMARPRTGILLRSEIGFLVWLGVKAKEKIEVGSRLKTPSNPIWLTLTGDKYGILFNPNKDLMQDYHAENRFELFYFGGGSSEGTTTTLTIDTREHNFLDPFSAPPLDILIQTKWEDATVEWNGTEPYV